SADGYVGRSPEGMRAGLGAARRSARNKEVDTGCLMGSLEVDDHGLLVREVVEHRLERQLLAEARLLDAAVRNVRARYLVLVHLHEAGLQTLHRGEGDLQVLRPDRGGQAEVA